MIYGLSEQENEFLHLHLIDPLKKSGCRIYIFGSRATQKNKKFSDIDLLYQANSTTDPHLEKYIYTLMAAIEESKFPYKIDLVNEAELAASFRSKVNAEKIEL